MYLKNLLSNQILSILLTVSVMSSGQLIAQSSPANLPWGDHGIQHPQTGVCAHLTRLEKREPVLQMIADAGFTWVRSDFYWSKIETEKGQYSLPENYREIIDEVDAAGLKLVLLLNGKNKLYAPDDYNPEAYAKVSAWLANEVRGKAGAIEVLNEPANFGFTGVYGGSWNGVDKEMQEEDWVGKYVQLLNAAAEAIKEVNPGIKVIGLGSVPPVNFRQIKHGISPAVDGITDHPYSYRLIPEYLPFAAKDGILKRDGIATADEQGTYASQVQMYFELLEKYKGPKEIWLTEWGYPTFQEKKSGGLYAGFTQSAQAKYLLRRLFESLGLGIEVSMIYDFKNDGRNPYGAEHNFGLVDYDLNPKPAFHAVKNFNHFMADYRPSDIKVDVFPVSTRSETQPIIWDGTKIQATGKVMIYTFADSQDHQLVAVWSAERADGDRSSIMGDLEIHPGKKISTIRAFNPMSGEFQPVDFITKGERIVINDFTIPDSPIALELK